jgi:NADH-quinone oxidoreductase subunit H
MAMYSTLAEKVAAWLQDRIGPNRAVKADFTASADGLKVIRKKELNQIPKQIFILYRSSYSHEYGIDDKCSNSWGDKFHLLVGILYCKFRYRQCFIIHFAILSIGVYGIMIGGWASNNKFSLMGAVLPLKWYRMK